MKEYRVDLHLHTCLSPCGSLEMSPQRIVETALERGLDAIAVTDHNSTLQCPEIQALGEERGLMVFAGAEVTTREEAHCVALFADDRTRAAFQMYLDDYLPPVPNDPERFGDQVWVNARNEIVGEAPYLLISALPVPNDPERFGDQVWVNARNEIVGEAPYLLISALDRSVEQIAAVVHRLGGLFIAAHVERPSFSLISQLGFIDPSLPLDAIEFKDAARYERLLAAHAYLKHYTIYSASDAHDPGQIGTKYSLLRADVLDFEHLAMAFRKENGHTIVTA